MSKIVLVTGGAGFIGSNFIRYFLDEHPSYKVVNYDKLTYAGNLNNLMNIANHPNYVFVKGDICNSKEVKNLFESYYPNYIVHFAAESHVDRSISDANIFVETNVLGTQILLNNARDFKAEKFIQVSTDEVYGSLGKDGFFVEDMPAKPNSPYSASKAGADLLALASYKTYGLPVCITRCSNNYGPFQFPEKLIPLMIMQALADKELPVYGEGNNIRDWIHVLDHCRALDLVLHEGKIGEIYNIGANNEWKNIDLVKLLLDKLAKPHSLIKMVKDRPGHDLRYAIDAKKIRAELGWQPQVDFLSGLSATIDWYLTHEDWLTEIVNGEYVNYYKKNYEQR